MNQPEAHARSQSCPVWCEHSDELDHLIGENLAQRDGLLRQHVADAGSAPLSDSDVSGRRRVVSADVIQGEEITAEGVTVGEVRVWLYGLDDIVDLGADDLAAIADLVLAAREQLLAATQAAATQAAAR